MFLAVAAMAMCCLHLTVSTWVLSQPARVPANNQLGGEASSRFECCTARGADDGLGACRALLGPLPAMLQDTQHRVLLTGIALSAAVLSLHGMLMPVFLGQPSLPAAEISADDLGAALGQGAACGAAMGAALLFCGLVADSLLRCPKTVATALVAASAAGALGLRAVVAGHQSARPVLVMLGLLASHLSLGSYLGSALPLLVALPAANRARRPNPSIAAVLSAAIWAFWLLGDGLGAAAQLFLSWRIGLDGTVLFFGVALALHTVTVLTVPGWLRPLPVTEAAPRAFYRRKGTPAQ